MIKKSLILSLILGFLASAALADQFTETFAVGSRPELNVQNISGEISVLAGADGEIIVKVIRDDPDIDVAFDQVGDRVMVETRYPNRRHSFEGGVSFEIFFPAEGILELESVSGTIDVQGVSGDLELSTVSGDVVVSDSEGKLELNSVSGDVECGNLGPAELEASSISGSVVYEGDLLGGDYQFSSTSGKIHIIHGPDAAYHISGDTVSGSIKNRVGDEIKIEKDKWGPMKHLTGSVNGNGVDVEVDTVSGSIIIERR